jgi:glycosyltransferase involved in cell wall biosynthesis
MFDKIIDRLRAGNNINNKGSKGKIVFANLDVGSAIEQSGDQFIEWIKEVSGNISIFKDQTKEKHFYDFLSRERPRIVVVNSLYPRIITPLYYYKLADPSIKVILISRVFTDFFLKEGRPLKREDRAALHKFQYEDRLEDLCRLADSIFIINSCSIKERIPDWIADKVVDCCGTNSGDKFQIKRSWQERNKRFVVLGSLNPHKLSPDFLDRIKETDVMVDVYGNISNQPGWYADKFNNCPNIRYRGELPPGEVADKLNEYKYYLLPHNGYEPLCNSLHQAILCGCIPVVLEDYARGPDGNYWLKFARGMYFGCANMNHYIEAIKHLSKNDIEKGEELSVKNRERYISKYGGRAKGIKDIIKEFLNNK